MDERLRFVARLLDGEAMSEVCRALGTSHKTRSGSVEQPHTDQRNSAPFARRDCWSPLLSPPKSSPSDSPVEGNGFELSVPGRAIRPFGRGEDVFQ
jgi:hypothetical protein